jgi:hypothetical protein
MGAGAACASEQQYPEPPQASYSAKRFTLARDGASADVDGAEVSAEFYAAPKVLPILGRLFLDSEYAPAAPAPVTILSYRCWEERFASAVDVIGREISLDGRRRTVVAVLPHGFDFPKGACLWVPRIRS